MAKTSVTNIVEKIKRRFDYSITDSGLDTLVLDVLNDNVKVLKQLFYDYALYENISDQRTFKTEYNTPYIDIKVARIVGDATTFTGIAADTLNVTIDGVTTAAIAVAACTTIALVVTAINAAVGTTVAYTTGDGFLEIKSNTSGINSNVTIANNAGTPVTRLFSVAAERTSSGIGDLDEILMLSERTFKFALMMIPYQDFVSMYPDPDSIRAIVPDVAARWHDMLYFGPTPSAATLIYIDYIKSIPELTTSQTAASITGNYNTFVGVAGDTLNVTIDGTAYTAIDVSACNTIALVAAAINAAIPGTVAYVTSGGYLQIMSNTTGTSSNVTIAENTGTPVGRLFSIIADRTNSGLGSGSTSMPYDDTYDPLIIAMCKADMMAWLDSTNTAGITEAKVKAAELKKDLVVSAARNVRTNRQVSSRRNMIPYFSPRKKIVA